MRLFERRTVIRFGRRYPDAARPLSAWLKEIRNSHFENPAQLRQRFGTIDFVGDKVVFDIGGNKYRIVARIRYANLRAVQPLNGMVFVFFIGSD